MLTVNIVALKSLRQDCFHSAEALDFTSKTLILVLFLSHFFSHLKVIQALGVFKFLHMSLCCLLCVFYVQFTTESVTLKHQMYCNLNGQNQPFLFFIFLMVNKENPLNHPAVKKKNNSY